MDLKTKIGYASQHIESIARHDDADADVRKAALKAVAAKCDAEAALIDERVAAKIAAVLPTANEA